MVHFSVHNKEKEKGAKFLEMRFLYSCWEKKLCHFPNFNVFFMVKKKKYFYKYHQL